MAGYSIRSLAELSQEARGFFTQTVQGAVASVWANTFTVFAKVLALLGFENELRRRWLAQQQFASTADEVWLARHGFELGLTRGAGSPAFGTITVPANPDTSVPAGLVFVRPDGMIVTTLNAATASGNAVSLYVEADEAGASGNTPAGTSLALSPDSEAPEGLGETATVDAAPDSSGLSGGSDPEALETFRARVLARKRNPPHGGSGADYQAWVREALETVAGVWVDSFQNDSRSVWVQFTVTDQPTGIPSVGQVARVQAYLDDPIRRPVTARVFVSAPIRQVVAVTIKGLRPDTDDVRASIGAELLAAFFDRAEPGKPSAPFVLSRSWLNEAISRATGEDRHVLVQPPTDVTFAAGRYPVLGAVAYTD